MARPRARSLRPAARRLAREFAATDDAFGSLALPDAARWILGWIRAVSRDLRQGGVVLMFPAGRLEPDPAVLGTRGALRPWSASVDIIRRHAPEAQVVPAAVTGVLSERAFAHPLTWLRRAPLDRQRVATLVQMIDLQFRRVTARVAFGEPIYLETDVDLNSQLASRMNQLISGPSDWAPLSRRSPDALTTTAA